MDAGISRTKFARWLWPVLAGGLWLALGLVGNAALAAAWRSAQVAEFRRAVEAVAELISLGHWSDPWESDPRWARLETQFQADLVPLAASSKGQGEDWTGSALWVLSPSGQWRATVTARLAAEGSRVRALRATRTLDTFAVNAVWWSAWSGMAGLFLVALVAMRSRRRPGTTPAVREAGPGRSDALGAHLESLEREAHRATSILDRLHEGVLAVDDQSRVLLINRVLRIQLELGSEAVEMRPLVEVVRVPRVVELLEQAMRSEATCEQTIELGNGARFLRLIATPLPFGMQAGSSGSSSSGALLTAIDVSSSQRSELARREFITGASHELKTPLAAIRAYTETLQDIKQDDSEAAERFLKNILTQADRMDRLVSGMLQLARAESGALKLKLERIDAVATIQPCLVAAQAMAHAKGVSVAAQTPTSQLLVLADRDAFQTIASNLFSNAVRYTPAGGRVDIELRGDGEQAVLRVSDTGIGIAEADQQRVFERFYRVQKDRASDTGGTGLGLAIVKQLTQALGGTIELTSRKGKGTCFEIRLPAVGFTQSSSKLGGQPAPVR